MPSKLFTQLTGTAVLSCFRSEHVFWRYLLPRHIYENIYLVIVSVSILLRQCWSRITFSARSTTLWQSQVAPECLLTTFCYSLQICIPSYGEMQFLLKCIGEAYFVFNTTLDKFWRESSGSLNLLHSCFIDI